MYTSAPNRWPRGGDKPFRIESLEPRNCMAADLFVTAAPATNGEPAVKHAVASSSPSAGMQPDVVYAHQQLGLTGLGQTVVVIDSGIAYDHPALGGGLGSSYRVVGGWDFAEGDGNPYDDLPGGLHGTHVAGIIGSSDPRYIGVAPQVDLVALRVFDDQGSGGFERIEEALQWVVRHRTSFENPITTVNISIGAAWNASSAPAWSTMEDELAQLATSGILVTASAGNDFQSYGVAGLSYPAASPFVLAVGSQNLQGNLSPYSQRDSSILVAPGDQVLSTVPDYAFDFNGRTDDFMALSGTSMAAPYLAGASVLLREAIQRTQGHSITGAEVEQIFRQTARSVFDPLTQRTYGHVDLVAALQSVIPADERGSPTSPDILGPLNRVLSTTGIIQNSSDADYVRFQATRTGTIRIDVDWNGEVGDRPSWIANNHAISLSNGVGTMAVRAGESYTLAVASGGGLGRYTLELAYAGNSTLPTRTPQAPADGDSESRLQWQATDTGYVTIRADFADASAVDTFSIRNSSSGQSVANIANPTTHEVLVLPVRRGEHFEFTVRGRRTDADIAIRRGSAAHGGLGSTILVTRMSTGNEMPNTMHSMRIVSASSTGESAKECKRMQHDQQAAADAWMAEMSTENSGSVTVPLAVRNSEEYVLVAARSVMRSEQIEAIEISAAFDSLHAWYCGGVILSAL